MDVIINEFKEICINTPYDLIHNNCHTWTNKLLEFLSQ